ncbi:MAG: hypothetical protein IJL14_10380 [Selenomonadaceae bacterium]|nr:hypothetical protein [Selenomonadaceae bacterium]
MLIKRLKLNMNAKNFFFKSITSNIYLVVERIQFAAHNSCHPQNSNEIFNFIAVNVS